MQNLLSSTLLFKNIRLKIYRIIILPVVLYGCENLSRTLKEKLRLTLIKNRIVKKDYANDTIGNQTRGLSDCNAVSQPSPPIISTRY